MLRADQMLELEELLRCPIDWVQLTGQPEPHDWLEYDWYKCIVDHAVSSDDSFLAFQMAQFRQLLDQDLDENTLSNLKMRRERVLKSFGAGSKRLSEIMFLSPSYNGKHFKPGLSDEEVLAKSRNGASLYFEDFSSDLIANAFWTWFQQYFDTSIPFHQYLSRYPIDGNFPANEFVTWDKFQGLSQFRVACNCLDIVGAVKGTLTSYVAFDVAMDSRVVHSYPVLRTQAETYMDASYVLGVRAFPSARPITIA